MRTTRLRATIKARTPEEFERWWRRLAEETCRKKENATPTTTPTEANR